ncbi:MAG: phage minor capsid protein [Anaerococcus vaginalis]|nr:phage minor capsid protein [Anaerococcus vaginalis]
MLSPEYMERVTDNLIELYQDLEDAILEDIAKRINKNGYLTATAERQAEVLIQNGYTSEEIGSLLNPYLDDIDEEIYDIINRSSLKHYEDEMKAYRTVNKSLVDLSKNNHVNNTIASAMDRLIEGNGNITKSLGVVYNGENIKLNDFYKKSLNQAAFQVASGAFSRQQVVRNLVNNLSDSGIRVINYQNSGRNYTVESASKMLVRTTLNQMTGDISLMNAEDMGQDLMEISAHAGARPSHAEWQGQIVSLSGDNDKYLSLDDIGYGDVTGFMGANCRHNWYPFFEGISERAWTKEMLENIDPEPFEFEDKEYTFYEATQKQRQIERTIRKYKHRVMMYDKVGDDESKLIAQVRLQRQMQLYKNFNKAGKLRPTSVNTHVYRYNRSKASKEVWANIKAQKKANELYNLGSDKLNLDIYLKDEKLRKAIRSDYNLTINPGRQDKHIQDTNNYKQELAKGTHKSYLLDSVNPQELVDKYAGTGELRRVKNVGKWINKEFIEADKDIGYWINSKNGDEVITSRFSISYSKEKGVHIVPAKPKHYRR